MSDPPPQPPDGRIDQNNADPTSIDQGMLDRSQQAARFLDLARQHALEPEEPSELNPLIAARLHDAVEDFIAVSFDDGSRQDGDGPGDDDDFGDGNGFAAGMPFGLDDTPLDPF